MGFPSFTASDVLTAANLNACFTIPIAKVVPADLTVAHGSVTTVDFASSTTTYDSHSLVDVANDRFVIPATWGGYYRIIAKATFNADTDGDGDRSLAVYVNGTTVDQDQRRAVADVSDTYFDNTLRLTTSPIALAAGDLVTFKLFQNSGSSQTVTGSKSFYAIEFVRPS